MNLRRRDSRSSAMVFEFNFDYKIVERSYLLRIGGVARTPWKPKGFAWLRSDVEFAAGARSSYNAGEEGKEHHRH